MNKIPFYFLFLPLICFLFAACGDDDDETPESKTVVIGDDGKASNGMKFAAIDDKNFYLDYIKYTVEEGHVIVSGYEKDKFKGYAKIVSNISLKGNSYEVTGIGFKSFAKCETLVSVIIPNSVKDIGVYAFDGCTGLKEVHCGWSNPPDLYLYMNLDNLIYYYRFNDSSYSSVTLYIPKGAIESYKTTLPWSLFEKIVEE